MEKQELTVKYSQLHPAEEERQAGERYRGMETSSLQACSDGERWLPYSARKRKNTLYF